MGNKFLNFLLLTNLLLIGCLGSSSNSSSKDYAELKAYMKKVHSYKLDPNINTIFVLTDKGCAPCNKKFAKRLELMDNDSSVILITAKQTSINLSSFDISTKKNVFHDLYFSDDYSFLRRSKVIYLGESKIDSVIQLNLPELDDQFNTIFNSAKQ